jgi:hypothetical protein
LNILNKIIQMLLHPTSKALIQQFQQSLEMSSKDLLEWNQKLIRAQKYEDAAAIDDVLKKAIELQLLLTHLQHD